MRENIKVGTKITNLLVCQTFHNNRYVAFLRSNTYKLIPIILFLFVLGYISLFIKISLERYTTFNTSYFDLTAHYHPTYNSYMAIKNKDFNRILEITDPYVSGVQLKSYAFHANFIMVFYSLFLFIHDGPETLLILQTVVLGLGAFALYYIAREILAKHSPWLSLSIAVSYLFFPYLQYTNIFDFHAVVPVTTFLLFMFYFWLKKKYLLGFLFAIISMISKENVPLTLVGFGFVAAMSTFFPIIKSHKLERRNLIYSIGLLFISLLYFGFIMLFVIPNASLIKKSLYSGYYATLTSGINGVSVSSFVHVLQVLFKKFFSFKGSSYLIAMFRPVGYFALFSPIFLLLFPELFVNIVSDNSNMSRFIFQYTALITPMLYIATIYGVKNFLKLFSKLFGYRNSLIIVYFHLLVLLMGAIPSSPAYYFLRDRYEYRRFLKMGRLKLNYSQHKKNVLYWKKLLSSDDYKVAASRSLTPYFANRRYLYLYPGSYLNSDYVVIFKKEKDAYIGYEEGMSITKPPIDKDTFVPVEKNPGFEKVFDDGGFLVYKKI